MTRAFSAMQGNANARVAHGLMTVRHACVSFWSANGGVRWDGVCWGDGTCQTGGAHQTAASRTAAFRVRGAFLAADACRAAACDTERA